MGRFWKAVQDIGEIEKLLHERFLELGAAAEELTHRETEMEALRDALGWAQPGDLVIMLSLAEKHAVQDYLKNLDQSV